MTVLQGGPWTVTGSQAGRISGGVLGVDAPRVWVWLTLAGRDAARVADATGHQRTARASL
jgi:hypothetical protein